MNDAAVNDAAVNDVVLGGLEDLAPMHAAPRRRLSSPVVSDRLLALLCGQLDDDGVWAAEPARAELVAGGWFTESGDATERTLQIRADLGQERTALTMRATDVRGVRRAWICAGHEVAVVGVEEGELPLDADPDRTPRGPLTFEVVPVSSLPLVFARWGGLAPTWNYDAPHEVPDTAVQARIADETAALPVGADDGLVGLWSRPWTRWSISRPEGPDDANPSLGVPTRTHLEYVGVEGAGQYVVRRRHDGATVFAPRPGSLVWGDLQQLLAGLPGQAPVDEDDAPQW